MAKQVKAFVGFNNKLFINETDSDVDIEKNISKQIENLVVKQIHKILKDKTDSLQHEKSVISDFIINYRPEILKIYRMMNSKQVELSTKYRDNSLSDDSFMPLDENYLDETVTNGSTLG
tara:strand:+ start:469 stop:825 length:357 start_codon:yes stop_codon:yes gene_type:complete